MTYFRRFGAQITFLVLSVIGVAISIYLTVAHYANAPVACSTNGLIDCERVLSSVYSFVPGTSIPISVPGLLWFLMSAVLAVLAWKVWPVWRALRVGQTIWFALGMLTALYLVYVEIVQLKKICAWCTSLHIIMLVMLLVAVFQLIQASSDEDEGEFEDDEEEEAVSQITAQQHQM
ncbi:vitamin K epoxide reductase family protein [Dictyobacter arantiisoli]|uniref:Vitamin K epoxide reductase domain-containing protein n=1 Tax=Dictyobacter arantiisoli TaxID=2014874 RepID=A0A5A5TA99_9CHLR|nr:vitamin K epoxide reductase family protein [Dictyobacter arantiisoli]GCF07943.1 hypothetical protein KDI_15070 [Dictyobacter arantiisoli]